MEKMVFVFEKITSEFVAVNCLYQQENTCHRYSVCQQTVLRFCIFVRESFGMTITLAVINKYGKGAVLDISRMFGRFYPVAFRRILLNGTF